MSESFFKVPREPERKRKSILGDGCGCLLIVVILFLLAGVLTPPFPGGIRHILPNAMMQTSRQIGVAMFAYANDNNQIYPDGKSSTEVFQKLLDGNYVTDPAIFYIPMPGKIKPVEGQKKLLPENISYDVTGGVDASSSDLLPLIYSTGYKVSFTPGAAAMPLIKPYPMYGDRSWLRSLYARDDGFTPGIAVYYKGNNAKYVPLLGLSAEGGSIPNFISPAYKPKGQTYRQLTPDGSLRR
jgi:hypothetical protein